MFSKVLVPLDQSSLAEAALGRAVALVQATGAALDLVLVHESFALGAFEDPPWERERLTREQAYLERVAQEIESGSSVRATCAVVKGRPVEMICQRASDVGADLIVMTSHGRTGFNRAWLGSVADGIVREAGIPVLLLRSREEQPSERVHRLFDHVLALIDSSSVSETILGDAISIARAGGGHVTLLEIIQPVPIILPDYGMPLAGAPPVEDTEASERVAAEARDRLGMLATRATDGVNVNTAVVIDAHVAKAILDFAAQTAVDLVAMTTRGRGASRLIVGSIADKVLRGSNLPVLLERPRDA